MISGENADMNFYYVNENNEPTIIRGSNKELYETAMKLGKKEASNLGFLGVISKNKLRATLTFHCYNKTVYTTVTQFIRKHAARAALERLCK
jgi:hypothetical protein